MSVARMMQMAAAGSAGAGPEPEVVGIENTISSSGTTPSITLPSGISSGDVIVIFVGVDGTPTASITGFSQDIAAVGGWAASATYYVFSKTADGTEGSSVTLSISASEVVCASAWVITNANDVAFSAVATNAGSVNPDSPSLTSGFGAVPTFWISSFATDNGTPTITAYPSGYENGQSLSGGANFGSPRLGVSSTVASVATEDPPAYTISEAHNWVAVTVAIGTSAPAEWTDPDLANASYDSVSFSVAGQDTIPVSLFFGADGEKLFVLGNSNDAIFQYSLSSAYDLSTASYDSVSFSVSSQETAVSCLSFSHDGTVMYISGSGTDSVFQYTLSTAWDLSTASYASKSFSASSQDTAIIGLSFSASGDTMYLSGGANDTIFQYSLSTSWDISTASYASKSYSAAALDGNPRQHFWSPAGDKLWFLGLSTDAVYELDISTAFDISTAAYNSVSFSVASQDSTPAGVFFKSDGSKMYVVGITNDTIYQYSTA